MMSYSEELRNAVKRALSRLPGFLVVLVLATILYLSTLGFPDWLTARLLTRINSGDMVLNSGVMTLAPLHRELILEDVQLYRKRVVGPAAVEAKRLVLRVDLAAMVRKKFCIRSVRIVDGTVRPKLFSSGDPEPDRPVDPNRKLSLVVDLERCLIQGVNVVSLSTDLRIDGLFVRLENLGGTVSQGGVSGDLSGGFVYDLTTHVLDGRLMTRFDPHLLIPLMQECDMPGTVDLVSRFAFNRQPPQCEMTFKKSGDASGDFLLDGKFAFAEGSYQGVDVLKANGNVRVDLTGSNLLVKVAIDDLVRTEGHVRTTFTIDLNRQEVAFEGTSGIHAPEFFQMVGVFTNVCRQFFDFKGPVKIEARGVVDYGTLSNTHFHAVVSAERMGVGPMMTDRCSFNMQMDGLSNTVSEVKGTLYGGEITGSAVFVIPSFPETHVSYSVDARVTDADFKAFLCSVVSEARDMKYSGTFGGWVKVHGLLGEGLGRTAAGKGYVYVKKGTIFTMPVFGGLTEFMTRHVPGFEFILEQTDAKTDFSIADGRVFSPEILVEGGVLSLKGEGEYYFLDKNLNLKVKVRLLKNKTVLGKIVQFVTDPISELFEFKLKGTLTKPEWSPLHL